MREFTRAMVVPFFMVLFPSLWYINRNLTTPVLPPRIEPTPRIITVAVSGAIAGSALFAAVVVFLGAVGNAVLGDTLRALLPSGRLQRALHLDTPALVIFFGVFCGVVMWGVAGTVGIGWLEIVLWPLAVVVLLPLHLAVVILYGVGLESLDHVLTVAGLVLSAVWLAVLSTAVSEALHTRWRE